jgi:hypothetical protein
MIMKSCGIALITLLAVIAGGGVGPAGAIEKNRYNHYSKQGDFEEVLHDLQDAVINRGLVIDYIGHVNTMLNRTSEAAESVTKTGNKSPYLNAKYIQFCSAKLTHEAVSANPYDLAICPYVVFIFEAHSEPGKIVVGYRRPIPGPSQMTRDAFAKIDGLLEEIVKEAVSE